MSVRTEQLAVECPRSRKSEDARIVARLSGAGTSLRRAALHHDRLDGLVGRGVLRASSDFD